MKYLVEAGAHINIPNREGKTPFDFGDESKKQIELALVGNKQKNKIDLRKVEVTLDNLNSIKQILHKRPEMVE